MNNERLTLARNAYQRAVNDWIVAIRIEEHTARRQCTVADLDEWERTYQFEEVERNKVRAAKDAYQSALRQTLFHF